MPLRVVITGASSGIGRALALQYARQGATIGILGRNRDRLETTASQCQAFGAQVHAATIDVRERSAMTEWLTDFDRATPVDVLIANAGVMEGTAPGQDIEAADPAYALMQTNVLGTLNTIQPLVAAMISRGHGQIAILSSIAGFIPLPDAPSYSASKAALTNYGLALRALLRPRGIGVSVFCLGYVDTPRLAPLADGVVLVVAADATPLDASIAARKALERSGARVLGALITRQRRFVPDAIARRLGEN